MDSQQLKAALRLELAIDQFKAAAREAREAYGESMAGITADAGKAGVALDTSLGGAGDEAATAAASAGEAFISALDAIETEAKAAGAALLGALSAAGPAAETSATKTEKTLGASLKEIRAEAARSSAALNSAFGVVGVRSAETLKAEILKIDQALLRIANDTRVSGAEFDRAWSAGQSRISALRAEMDGAGGGASRLASQSTAAASQLAAMAAPLTAMFSVEKFLAVNNEFQSITRTLTQMKGSSVLAAEEFDYIKATANRMGLEVGEAARQYIALSAATKGTTLEGERTRKIFESVAGAMSMLGKGSEETGRALTAIAQMASKGTVSMEELRGQLSEALPGALQAAASASGLTVQELEKMVSTGDVLADDLLPRLAAGLDKMYGGSTEKANTLSAAWARMKNTLAEGFATEGGTSFLTRALDNVSTAMEVLFTVSRNLREGIASLWQRMTEGVPAIDRTITGIDALGKAIADAAARLGIYTPKVDAATAATEKAADAQTKAGTAAAQAGQAAASAGGDWLKLQAAHSKAEESAKQYTTQVEKELAARTEQVKSIDAVAQAFGTETEKRQTAAAGAQALADSSHALADAKRKEADEAARYVVKLQEEVAGQTTLSEAKKKAIDDAKRNAEATAADAQKAAAAADGARVHAEALNFQAKAYEDNSAKVAQYKKALDDAKQALNALTASGPPNAETMRAVQQAQLQVKEATALYRDALTDATAAAERAVAAQQRNAAKVQGTLSLERERLVTMRDVAKAYGNEAQASKINQEIRDLDIKLLKAQAAASRAQAEAILQSVKATRAELEAKGELTAAAKASLDARIAEAEAKKVDAERAEILAGRIRDVAAATDQMRERGDGAADGLRDSFDRATEASDRLNESIRNRPRGGGGGGAGGTGKDLTTEQMKAAGWSARDIENYQVNRQGSAPDGYANRQVNTQVIDHRQLALQMGLTGEKADKFAAVFGDFLTQAVMKMNGSLSGVPITAQHYADAYAGALAEAKRRAYDAANPLTMSTPSSVKTVRVELSVGGKTIPVTTDESSADALVRALQSAQLRA